MLRVLSPDVVHYVEELRGYAEVASRRSAKQTLTDYQTTALAWHYERVYRVLWRLASYALARFDPAATKKSSQEPHRDKYWGPFNLRYTHFMATAYKMAGMLPPNLEIPPADRPARPDLFDRRGDLDNLGTP